MFQYVARRTTSSLIALFIFLTIMFFVTEIIIPGDFTTQFALSHNQEQRDEMREDLGLDLPLWERYVHWLRRILSGSLGNSLYGPPVIEVLKGMLPYTLLVFFTGTVIAFLLGQWLGKVVAWQGRRFTSRLAQVGSGLLSGTATLSAIVLYTSFPPWLAFLVTYFLAHRLGFFRRAYGNNPFGQAREIWRDFPWPVSRVMLHMVLVIFTVAFVMLILKKVLRRKLRRPLPIGLLWFEVPLFLAGVVGGWFLLDFGPQAVDVLKVAGLPLITYVLLSFGETMLIMRTSMMDTLKETYVVTARAKGLPDRVVRDKHAARNALLPALSRMVISLPYLLTGVVIVEKQFDWPGLSDMLFDSFYQQDMPLILGGLLMIGLFSAIVRLVLDMIYAYLDPRIRHRMTRKGKSL